MGDSNRSNQEVPGSEISPPASGLNRCEFLRGAAFASASGLALKSDLSHEALFAFPASAATYLTEDRIAATPAFNYRAYRSKAAKTPDVNSWVQIDLEQEHAVEAVKLYPANQKLIPGQDAYYTGEGFPLRLKIEVSREAGFSRA